MANLQETRLKISKFLSKHFFPIKIEIADELMLIKMPKLV